MPRTRTPPLVLSPAERERIDEVRALAARGEAAVAPLVPRLADPSWAVRREVVDALASLGDAAAHALVELLETRRDDETLLAAAVDTLVEASGDEVDGAVIAMAQDERSAVVADAAQILGRRRSRAGVPTLVALTRHPDENVAVAATEALGRIGGRSAVDSLVDALRARQFFRTFPAIDVLSRTHDPRAVAPLAELLDDAQYCFEALRGLGRTGDPLAVASLAGMLGRASDAVVRVAALALAELHDRHAERFGRTHEVEEELRRTVPPNAVRNLCRALGGASSAEQIGICRVLGALGSEDAVADLTPLLDGPAPVARAATSALERIGKEAAAQIEAALREGDSATRRAILPVLRARRHSLDGVLACLEDPDPAVRASACETLARAADPGVVPALFEHLSDPDPRVVQAVTSAIQSLGTHETERLALAAARSGDRRVRSAAFRILAYFGYGAALPIFIEALRGSDARLRDEAIHGLRFIEGPEAFDALLETARHPEARVRAAAMRSLGYAGESLRAQAQLLRGIADEDGWVRYYACQSLGRVGSASVAPALARLLDDPAGQVRVAAIEALSHLDGPVAMEALVRATRAEDADVRRAALIGLGISRRPESVPLLSTAARSEDPPTRLVAISALAGFEGPDVLEQLALAARDPVESVRVAAVGFLAARSGEGATRRLIALLDEPKVASQALAGLSRFSPERVRVIVRALERADDETAPLLAAALARMQVPEAHRALTGVLSSGGGPAGRRAAAEAVAGLGAPEMIEALDECASRDPDAEVRRVCSASLSRWQH